MYWQSNKVVKNGGIYTVIIKPSPSWLALHSCFLGYLCRDTLFLGAWWFPPWWSPTLSWGACSWPASPDVPVIITLAWILYFLTGKSWKGPTMPFASAGFLHCSHRVILLWLACKPVLQRLNVIKEDNLKQLEILLPVYFTGFENSVLNLHHQAFFAGLWQTLVVPTWNT